MSSFTGYVYREEQDSTKRKEDSDFESDSDEDDFDGADQDFDFLHKPSRKLRNAVENMKQMKFVDGRFVPKPGITRVRGRLDRLFCQPWWLVELKINATKSSKNEMLASSLPSYSLRTDDDVGENLLSLFLTKGCKVHPQHVTLLLEFIRRSNLKSTLKDLMENLEKFADSGEEGQNAVASQIHTSLYCSPTGKAFTVPLFTKYAHRLFPNHVCQIFDECPQQELEDLNGALQRESWVFGYWTILRNRFGLAGCEVKLKSFIDCDLLQEMPRSMQDALRIYDGLCNMMRKYGHTYVFLWQLKMKLASDVKTWAESLAYLAEINVVKTSENHLGEGRHVFLTHIRGFEKKIAQNLAEVMENKSWVGNIEIDEQVFGGDKDQVKAAKLMVGKPVVVMSGRGGCGKTYVVSNVLSKALDIKRRKVVQDYPVDFENANFRTLDTDNEVPTASSPDLNAQTSQDSSHKSDTNEWEVKLDVQCDLASSDFDPVLQVNEEPSSEFSAQAHKLQEDEDKALLTISNGKAASTLDMTRKEVIQDHTIDLENATFRTPNAEDEVSFPNLEVQTTQDSSHKSNSNVLEVKLDEQCGPADSNVDPVPQMNEKLSSEQKAQLRKQKTKLQEINDEVLLTAPTGKAASILGKRTRLPSHTLHSVIYSFLGWEKEGQGDWKFSKVRLLVCDECSLIPVRVFSKLISILNENAQLQQVILLGDINQLPSIEPGNFLKDVYQALMPHGVSIALSTNHRAESELIVQNAIKISNQEEPLFDESRGFVSVEYQPKRNDDDNESNKINHVVKDVLQDKEKAFVLPGPEASQFIAFRRNDCNIINEQCALHYQGHSIRNERHKPNFQIGDKVCVRRNVECWDEYEKKGVKLCNGEIFFIRDIIEEIDNRGKKVSKFSIDNGEREMKIDFKSLKTAKLTHAWARTIHTFQGSENDTVVYVVGSPYYQNWQHVYTAVTRGVRQVIIINNPSSLYRAIRSDPVKRQTKLEEDLKQAMENRDLLDDDVCGLETTTQFATQCGGVPKSESAPQPVDVIIPSSAFSEPEDQERASETFGSRPVAAPSSDGFCISRENLRNKKLKQDQDEQRYPAASSRDRCHEVSAQTEQEISVNTLEVSTLQSPDRKRKHPDSTILMSPPQTPPHFRQLPSSLSSVSPFDQAPRETQENVASRQSVENILITARHGGQCRVCKNRIRPGVDEITFVRKPGSDKHWIHGRCATRD